MCPDVSVWDPESPASAVRSLQWRRMQYQAPSHEQYQAPRRH